MHLNGELRPKPTSRLFLQDAVSGGRALMERPAALRATWARGRLRVAYRGPCYCSKDVVPHCVEINQCVGCTPRNEAAVLAPSSGGRPIPPRR